MAKLRRVTTPQELYDITMAAYGKMRKQSCKLGADMAVEIAKEFKQRGISRTVTVGNGTTGSPELHLVRDRLALLVEADVKFSLCIAESLWEE